MATIERKLTFLGVGSAGTAQPGVEVTVGLGEPPDELFLTIGEDNDRVHRQAMFGLLRHAFNRGWAVRIDVDDPSLAKPQITSVELRANRPPTASFTRTPDTRTVPPEVGFDGSASSDPDGTVTAHDWNFGDGATSTGETVVHTYANPGRYFATLTVTDDNGARNSTGQIVEVGPPLDPALVAPPLDRTVATDLFTATEFLYTGLDRVQDGVVPGTIEPRRAAVVRGRVVTRADVPRPIPEVRISVLGHPEFGFTRSRSDGAFDLVVNGGGQLTLLYEKDSLLPAQRRTTAAWQEYACQPAVAMVPLSAQVGSVDLSNIPADGVTVRGGTESDGDGDRRSTLLFPQGTTAEIVTDAGAQRLANLRVRATEFTLGEKGPDAMPAELPPTSAYTYALEFTADEALAAGAREVRFDENNPLIHYVENFLGLPVGESVPVGYYDRESGTWVPSEDGKIIQVLSVQGGIAELDLDGSGQPAGAASLAAISPQITEAERRHLAGLYQPGRSLWRTPIAHFTPYDWNWPFGPPDDATDPRQRRPRGDDRDDEPCIAGGSTIEIQNQTLGESIGITGTPFTLNYSSDRVLGRTAAFTAEIPLSGTDVPASLKRIELEVSIAGQLERRSFPPNPDQSFTFTWDGKDAYDRTLQGAQQAKVRICYVYDAVYTRPAMALGRSFAALGNGVRISPGLTRQEVFLCQERTVFLGTWDAKALGLGGWSLDAHHAYDHSGKVLYLGDGRRRSAVSLGLVIGTVAGRGAPPDTLGDNGPATGARLNLPQGVAVGPDGSYFVAESGRNRIRRVGPGGTITTVAGTDAAGFSGDDGAPARSAQFTSPNGVAVGPDGSCYVAERFNHCIRRVEFGQKANDWTITRVAGIGGQTSGGFNGDTLPGGDARPAREAQLSGPRGVAVASDGGILIADTVNQAIRRVATDGTIATVAGRGNPPDGLGDGGPATEARLDGPFGVAAGTDGSFYIADRNNNRIRRVGPDGTITTVAGGGNLLDDAADGSLATEAKLNTPNGVAVGLDGSLYFVEGGNHRVRRVGPDGIITTVAGTGVPGFGGDGGPARGAQLQLVGQEPNGIAVGPDGSLYISDNSNRCVRRVEPALPGLPVGDFVIPSEDGTELYFFDSRGRLFHTLDALTNTSDPVTGMIRHRFEYDSEDRLAAVTDGDNNRTRIDRGANGNPQIVDIIGPFGQRTRLNLDTDGHLESITNPANETVRFTYSGTRNGLLETLTDPDSNPPYVFTYDTLGRLERDGDPAGGFTVLAQTSTANVSNVTLLTATTREESYRVEQLLSGDEQKTKRCCGAAGATEVHTNMDGTQTVTNSDRAVSTLIRGPDPRWGMQSPLARTINIATPGRPSSVLTTDRTVTLVDPDDPLSLERLVDTANFNGRTYRRTYEASTRMVTDDTPEGRRVVTVLDTKGRVVEIRAGDLLPIVYDYDARGRLKTATQGIGTEARTYDFDYASDGYLSTLRDPVNRTTSFGYDGAGRVETITRPDQQRIGFSYDDNGNLKTLTPPGKPAHNFTRYSAVNLLEEYNPPVVNGISTPTFYDYDDDRRLKRITNPSGQTVEPGYDPPSGRLNTLTLPTGQVRYTHDPTTGNLIGITTPDGVNLSYGYDGELLTSETWIGAIAGRVSTTYDSDYRVDSQSVNGANTIDYDHDEDSLLTRVGELSLSRDFLMGRRIGLLTGTTIGDITDMVSFTDFGEPKSYRAAHAGTLVFAVQYTGFDKLGRLTEKSETVNGQTNTYSYIYETVDDPNGRLKEVKKNGTRIARYDYDANGNRLSFIGEDGIPILGTYDHRDRLERYGNTIYTYTASGELESKTTVAQRTRYEYDVLGNLKVVTLPDNTRIEYVVDGLNRRIGKKMNGILRQGFLYEGQLRPVAELDDNGNLMSRFVYATRANVPDYIVKGGNTFRIVTDYVGSPRLVVDTATGQIAQRIDYDEFGNILNDTNPGFQPFGFAGGLYDIHTQLVRFGARDYDAETGRWTAKDPLLFDDGNTNLYTYELNDPINEVDPVGLARRLGPNHIDLTINQHDVGAYLGNLRRFVQQQLAHGGGDEGHKTKLKSTLRNAQKLLSKTEYRAARNIAKRAGLLGATLFVVLDSRDAIAADLSNPCGGYRNTTRFAGRTAGSILTAALAAAALGSFVPGAGTVVGFTVGLVGAWVGSYIGEAIADWF